MEVWLCCFIDASLQLLLQRVRVAARGPAWYLRREPFCSQVGPSSSSCLGAGGEWGESCAAFLEATPVPHSQPGPSRNCCCLLCMYTAYLSWISLSSFFSRQDALFCRFHPSISSQADAVSTPSFVFLYLKKCFNWWKIPSQYCVGFLPYDNLLLIPTVGRTFKYSSQNSSHYTGSHPSLEPALWSQTILGLYPDSGVYLLCDLGKVT